MAEKHNDQLLVRFHGVRGTLASPGREFQRAGGNTICAEVRCGDRVLICDAGTGIRKLGSQLLEQQDVRKIDILMTHVHYDHVEGIPFFGPFFSPDFRINVWLGKVDGADSTEEAVRGLMRRPYFPVGPDVFQADVSFRCVAENQELDLGDGIHVRTAPLNHPGGATGYRIEYKGRSFAFVTDTEHVPGKPDENVLRLISGVDAFVYDASLTDAELPEFRGYGHSTWEEGMRLRKKTGAKRFLALHHMPFRTDADLDIIEAAIKTQHPSSGVAREGDTLVL
ncbi:MAG: MBL fold metallo-hydrolase [Rhizobiaceae bacterium]